MKKRPYTRRINIYKVNFLLKDGRTTSMLDRCASKPNMEDLEEKFKQYFPAVPFDQVKGISYQIIPPAKFKKLFNQLKNA